MSGTGGGRKGGAEGHRLPDGGPAASTRCDALVALGEPQALNSHFRLLRYRAQEVVERDGLTAIAAAYLHASHGRWTDRTGCRLGSGTRTRRSCCGAKLGCAPGCGGVSTERRKKRSFCLSVSGADSSVNATVTVAPGCRLAPEKPVESVDRLE